MAKYNNKFIVVDTETGGIPNKGECKGKQATIDVMLMEFAAVVVNSESLEITEKHSFLIKPYDDDLIFTVGAEKVSGLNREICEREGVELEQAYNNIVKILKDNTDKSLKPIIIMQNKDFDIPFLENLFAIFNDKFSSYIHSVEDTMEWSRKKWCMEGKHSLGVIAERCGIDLVDGHRALRDTIITAQVWIHFMKLLRGNIGEVKEEVKFRESFQI